MVATATIEKLEPGRKVLMINYDHTHFGVEPQGSVWQFVNWSRLPETWLADFKATQVMMIGPGGPINSELAGLLAHSGITEDRIWRLTYREAEFRFLLLTEGAA